MRYRFCIPSYKRSESVKTVEYLSSGGASKEEIFIFVRDDEVQKYFANYGEKANIIRSPHTNVAEARNNILEYFSPKTKIVMLDDDISSIVRKKDKDCRKVGVPEFKEFLDFAFAYIETGNAKTFTFYPIANGFFMNENIDDKQIGLATVMGIINSGYRFDPEFALKEDYDFCLQQLKDGLNCVRFNYMSSTALHRVKGGVFDLWDDDDLYAKKLVNKYPELVALANNKSRIRFKKNGTM